MPQKQQDQSQTKWVADFIWNIADDRLIFGAVTGQVDLRGWQPGPDDVASDDDLAALGDDEAGSTDEEDSDGEEN